MITTDITIRRHLETKLEAVLLPISLGHLNRRVRETQDYLAARQLEALDHQMQIIPMKFSLN